ncbi:MAG TPA: MFS transporter [Bryobacteraceae bacterium]|nr:MFS transporter [Bryobacteraceae bacterium]
MTPGVATRTTLSRREWSVLLLLVISGFLNYFDRSNLSAGAADIQRDLGLSYTQIGNLLGAFFWTYALCQLLSISGWLVDRFNVGWILAIGFFLWSAATAATGLAQVFATVFALRLLLGVGESIAYPSYSRILVNHYPEHHRGLANALIDAGTKCGPALGTLLGGLLIERFGWRAFFVGLGLASFVWIGPWLVLMPRGKADAAPADAGDAPSVFEILGQRSAVFSALGLFCSNYFWYFLLTWLPLYLEKERHFSKDRWAVVGSLAYFLIAVSSVMSGRFSDLWIARGGSPTRVRKTFAGAGLALSTMIAAVAVIQNATWAMTVLMITCLCYGLFSSNLFAMTQTLAGPRAAGKWTAIQNGFGNFAGVAAPWFTGMVVQRTGHFYLAFVAAAAVALAGAGMFVLGIGRVEPVRWGAQGPNRASKGA